MSEPTQNNRMAHWVHWSLLTGVAISGLVLMAGLILDPDRGPHEAAGRDVAINEVIRGVEREDGVSLINLGLLLLMATPVLRIFVLGTGWLISGDRQFAGIAFAVLLLLLLSMWLSVG